MSSRRDALAAMTAMLLSTTASTAGEPGPGPIGPITLTLDASHLGRSRARERS